MSESTKPSGNLPLAEQYYYLQCVICKYPLQNIWQKYQVLSLNSTQWLAVTFGGVFYVLNSVKFEAPPQMK